MASAAKPSRVPALREDAAQQFAGRQAVLRRRKWQQLGPRTLKRHMGIVDYGAMDRRLDRRFPVDLAAKITDLSSRACVTGTVSNISASGVCVISPGQFDPGTVVKLEVADSALFGQVVHCTPDGLTFRIGIEVVRVLLGGTGLADLLNAVLVDTIPATPGLAHSPSRR